jgi:hypothetical protein
MLCNALRPRRRSYMSTISPIDGTRVPWLLAMIALCGFLTSQSFAQVSVLTQNADEGRDAVYSNETILTPTSQIHKLFTISLDSPLRGQALILGGVSVAGAPQNILLATTSPIEASGATSAWAFNADTGVKLWQLSLGTSAPFSTSTPVVDPNLGPHGALFVVIKDSATNTNKLHAIDVIAGTELTGSPITISASAGGQGFNSAQENSRTALLELNGTIYTSFCHMTDSGTYHGWLIGYKYTNGSGFSQNGVWCDTCSAGNLGGIWQGGDGPIFDGTSIFVATGNGSIGGGNFGMSVVKLNPSNLGTVEDSFLPPNAQNNSNSDLDLNGGGMVLIPGTGGKLFQGPSKYGSLYLLDSTNLAKGALQSFSANSTVGHSPIAWNSGTAQYAYVWPHGSTVQQYCYSSTSGNFSGGTTCHTSSFSAGGSLAISTDPSGGNAILWAFGGSELHAMNPANVSAADYWNSNMSTGDAIGNAGGFEYLSIANGKVYAPTGSTIVVYGETQVTCAPPSAPSGLSASAISSTQIDLSWTASTSSCSGLTYDAFRSTTQGFTPSSANQIANGLTGTTFSDTSVQPSTTYYYLVEAVNAGGTSPASNQAMATTPSGPPPVEINAGGPAVSPFTADADFSGGKTINHANTIDLTHVTNPAPEAVYQTARVATTTTNGVTSFTYTIPGYTAGTNHLVRLHFAETFWTAPGKRVFNVAINGTQVLTRFDIFATAGAANRANIQESTVSASSGGSFVITFTSVVDNALISGIEIH